jgi:hypothetical protein
MATWPATPKFMPDRLVGLGDPYRGHIISPKSSGRFHHDERLSRTGVRERRCIPRAPSQSDDHRSYYSWRSTLQKPLRSCCEPTLPASCSSVRMSRFNSRIHAFWPYDLVIAICKSRMYSQSGAASGPSGWYQASSSVQDSILGSLLDAQHPDIATVPGC